MADDSGSKNQKSSERNLKIRKGARSWLQEASPDDPIFTRGFVIGGRFSKRPPRSSDDGKKENQVARVTWKGLRKPDDPIYKQTSIVVGGGARPSSAKPSRESKSAKPKPKR